MKTSVESVSVMTEAVLEKLCIRRSSTRSVVFWTSRLSEGEEGGGVGKALTTCCARGLVGVTSAAEYSELDVPSIEADVAESNDRLVADEGDGEGDRKRPMRDSEEAAPKDAREAARISKTVFGEREHIQVASLRRLLTLPLLPRPLLPLPTRSLFRGAACASFSSSFFGGMFSLPLPHFLPPLGPAPKSGSPLPLPLPPGAPAPVRALRLLGLPTTGDDCVRVKTPTPPVRPPNRDGPGRLSNELSEGKEGALPRRVEGVNAVVVDR